MLQDKLTYLLTSRYWLEIHPAVTSITSQVLFGVGVALLITAGYARYKTAKVKVPAEQLLWSKMIAPSFTMGLFLLVWFGARFQQGYLIGSHLVGWVLLGIAMWWLVPVARYYRSHYKAGLETWKKEQEKLKYINMR